uniref:DUF1985 domain-containing protein n=1 Tax=Cannabis sativa TaxID=3483 RepID=A0A803NMS6_CANSA
MWFKFGSQNFKFSLAEFAVVIGLLCVGDSDMSAYAKKENVFVDKYFSDQQVTVSAVEKRFMYSDIKLDDYAVKMVVLYFVSNCLFSSPNSKKLKGEYIFATDEERTMLNLFGFEFIEKEDSDTDVDRGGAIGLQSSVLSELKRDIKQVIQKQFQCDGSFEDITSDIRCRSKELELNMISHIDSKIDESLQFYWDLKFNDLKEMFDDLKASQSVVDIRDDSGGDSDDGDGLQDVRDGDFFFFGEKDGAKAPDSLKQEKKIQQIKPTKG